MAGANGNGHGRNYGRNVLLIGEASTAAGTLIDAEPGAKVDRCDDWFDAIARLTQHSYDAVLAPTGPIERRPEAALRTLRDVAGNARVVLVSSPAQESLSRRLLKSGCDDYLIWPASPNDVRTALTTARAAQPPVAPTAPPPPQPEPLRVPPPVASPAIHLPDPHHTSSTLFTRAGLAVAEVILDAMVREPGDAARASLRELNSRLPVGARFELLKASDRDPVIPQGMMVLSHLLPATAETTPRVLHLFLSRSHDERAASAFLDQVAPQIARVIELQERHTRLQRLAITDDLTGLYNCRYFRHFLDKILSRAQQQRFSVTVLLFDIDNFKKYNDQFGHAAGDEILRQTGKMMRRCVRDHDLVARLGGDEFAVVFWDKEGPRQPVQGQTMSSRRAVDGPAQVFERFRRMLASHDFEALGPSGKGQLTISGGLAVYPWDAQTSKQLLDVADQKLMFGAKRSGKNSLHLVGPEENDEPAQH